MRMLPSGLKCPSFVAVGISISFTATRRGMEDLYSPLPLLRITRSTEHCNNYNRFFFDREIDSLRKSAS